MDLSDASKGIGTGIGIAAMGVGLGIAFDAMRDFKTRNKKKKMYKSYTMPKMEKIKPFKWK